MVTEDDVKQMHAAKDVDGLIKAIGDDAREVREYAAMVLTEIGDVRAVEPLIKALGDDSENVRYCAADALGRIGDVRAVEPLNKALGDDDEDVRSYAANALEDIGDMQAVESHIKALGAEDKYGCWFAARELGRIGDVRAVEPLIEALGDEDEDVRSSAAIALEGIGRRLDVHRLILIAQDGRMLDDGRKDPADMLEEIGDAAIVPLINALKRGESNITSLLERMSHPAVGIVFERLELYDDANEWYSSHGMLGAAAAVRRKKADMAAPKTEIHGDYIDDRDTIIKDSVVSKSTIGPGGGGGLMAELQQLSEMHKNGILSDEQFEAAKNKLLG